MVGVHLGQLYEIVSVCGEVKEKHEEGTDE